MILVCVSYPGQSGFPVFSGGPVASTGTPRADFLLCLVLFTTYIRKGFLLLRLEDIFFLISGKACIGVSSTNEVVTV